MTSSNKSSIGASLVVAVLLLLEMVPTALPVSAAATPVCTTQSNPFSVTGDYWGTSGAALSVYPGDQNVPLTITMLFSGPCSSPQSTFTLSLSSAVDPTPFTGPNGIPQPKTIALNIAPNTFVAETFYLSVDPKAATGVTYNTQMIIQYANNTASDVVTQLAFVPVTLQGPVELNFAANTSHLVAGVTNNVTVSISNTGAAPSGPISTTVTAPSSVTLLNQITSISSLGAGSNATRLLEMFVPSSLSGTAITLTFTAKYADAYANSQTVTQMVGFMVSTPTVQAGTSFVIESAQWGSSSSPTSPLPGTQDIELAVSLQYLGSTPVTSLQGTLALPSGITDLNGMSSAVSYSAATTNQYGSVQLTFYLDIASNVKPGSFSYPLTLNWMTSQSLGLSQTAAVMPPPIAQMVSSFQVQSASWTTSTSTTTTSAAAAAASPEPGSQGVPLVVNLQYLGTTSVTSVKGTLSMPSGITDLNGHSSATAFAATANANQVISLTFDVDVASTVKPGSYNFTLDLSWTTSVSVSLTQRVVVSPPPVGAISTTASFPLSVTQTNSTVTAGVQTSAGFQLTNTGTTAVYSPTFSLSVTSPLVLVSVSSPVTTSELDPGKSTTFIARVTSGPSAAAGIYSGTLTATFSDQNGATHSQTFPVGFTLEGTVTLILQNTQITQSATGFTVTGSILNEGSVPAYYASISGLIGLGIATPVYLGEIDPNTPLPFSVTIPFTAPAALTPTTNSSTTSGAASSSGSSSSFTRTFTGPVSGIGNITRTGSRIGNFSAGFPGRFNTTVGAGGASGAASIVLSLSYKDTFGKAQNQPFTLATTVKSASQLLGGATTTANTTSSSQTLLVDIAYGVVAAVVATLVVGSFLLRRHRAKEWNKLPDEMKGERSVI